MDDNKISKTDLWADRVHSFQESGLSRKDWCQQNEVPQSTFGYWFRKFQSGPSEPQDFPDPVFAKLPSEQELQNNAGTGNHPVTIPRKIKVALILSNRWFYHAIIIP